MAMNPGPDMEHDPQLAEIYRAGTEAGPPARLDEAIRAAARREVNAGPRRSGGLRRWQLPLSLAAVLVLSVTVVTQMREQGADRPEALLSPPAVAPSPRAAEESQAETLPPRAAGKPEAEVRRRDQAAPAPDRPAAPVSQAPAEPPPPAMASEQKMMTAPAESRVAPADAAPGVAEDAAGARSDRQAPRPLLRSAPAPLADRPAGSSAAAPARAVVKAVSEPALLWRDLIEAPMEKWIERIVELRRAGKTANADALATEFGRRFPDQRLPEEAR